MWKVVHLLRSCPPLFALVHLCNYFKNACHWVIYKQQKFIPHSSGGLGTPQPRQVQCLKSLLLREHLVPKSSYGKRWRRGIQPCAHTRSGPLTTHRYGQTGNAPNFTLLLFHSTHLLSSPQEGLNFSMNFGGVTDCPSQDSSHKGKSAPGRDADKEDMTLPWKPKLYMRGEGNAPLHSLLAFQH